MHWNIENRTKIVERISFKMTFKNYVAIQHHRLILVWYADNRTFAEI